MALDSRDKRASALNQPGGTDLLWPNPDGDISTVASREHMAGFYAWGLTAAPAAAATLFLDEARKAIEAVIAAAITSTDIVWPNRPYVMTSAYTWIEPTIVWEPSARLGMGAADAKVRRMRGRLEIGICGRPGTGRGPLYALADTVRNLFNRDLMSAAPMTVQFLAPAGVRPAGLVQGVERVVVTAPFEAIETV